MNHSITNPLGLDETDRKILQSSWFVATITTESGSHYTLIKRDNLAVMTKDNPDDPWVGRGTEFWISSTGRVTLFNAHGRPGHRMVGCTTRIRSCYILEN